MKFFFIFFVSGLVLYFLFSNINLLFFLDIETGNINVIKKIFTEAERTKDRMKKRVLLQKALKELNIYIENNGETDFFALYLLGKVYLKKSLFEYNKRLRNMFIDKAIYYFRKSLAFATEKKLISDIHFELGRCYFYKGEYYYYESLMELKKAKKMGLKNKYIDKLIAFIKFKKGNYSEINELIQNFKTSKEGSVEKYFFEAYKYKNKKEYERAMELFNKVVDYFSKTNADTDEKKYILMRTYYALGWLYYNQKKYKEAEKFYLLSKRFDENNPDIYYWLGKVYIAMNEKRKARKMFKTVLKLRPDYKYAKLKLKQLRRGR